MSPASGRAVSGLLERESIPAAASTMSRLALPNTDYLTDTKSVLDQTIRILQAMIDTSAENGWLSVCLSCQLLMQSIVQARWPADSPLTTLPHVESDQLYMFSQMARDTKKPCILLNGAIMDLPTLDIKLQIRGLWFDVDHEQDKREYTILINMNRRGGNPSNVLCPRFPRGKNEGWFVTLGTADNQELHALKRVPPRGTAQVTFYTPSYTGMHTYNVLCPRFPRGKNQGWFMTLGTADNQELHALKRVPPRGTAQVTFYTPSYTGMHTYNVLCPRFPRGKNEGWFVTLGTADNQELHALKRVPPRGTAQVTFYTPSYTGMHTYNVLCPRFPRGKNEGWFVTLGTADNQELHALKRIELIDPLPEENVQKVYTIDKTIIENKLFYIVGILFVLICEHFTYQNKDRSTQLDSYIYYIYFHF
ncbi:Uncharacterized protein OBRU01_13977 [Operophtera brumata]|uniref:SEC63 domain-containing protein n=1 Tax=Operophtera brumata TaxID=104452 RepID=A0A0L7L7F1_OPEBR|nr:Uncharacterized protein OBRU01_13977 [Operophtera brumata]